jgi:23S rRNA pseudouridine2605 synthase
VQKVYHVVVAGVPAQEELEQLTKGVRLAESWVKAERATLKSEHKQSATIEIVLREGKNREIRRLLARIGHKVMRLKRVQIGGVKLKDLEPGEWRRLRTEEVSWLRTSTYGDREEGSDDRERRPPRRSDGPRPEGRPPRTRSDASSARPARPPRDGQRRDSQRRDDDGARPPKPRPLPTTAGPNLAKGMMADEPGTIKPLPRARKPGKRHKRRVLIGTSLRKKKRS